MDAHREDDDTGTYEVDMNDEWVLDSEYPFEGPFPTGLTKQSILDSPIWPINDSWDWMKDEQHFKTYIMFKPAGTNSIYVPLAVIEWWWKGKAQEDGADWELAPGSDGWNDDPEVTSTWVYPEWEKNSDNYDWTPE